jgi:hypothetical protein
LTYQIKILKDKNGKDLVLFSRWLNDGVSNEPVLRFFDIKGNTKDFSEAMPNFEKSSFFVASTAPDDVETVEQYSQFFWYYNLAETGNKVSVVGGFHGLEKNDPVAKKLKKILLRWDSAKGIFVK